MSTDSPLSVLTEQITRVYRGYVTAMLWANATCEVESCEGRDAGTDCEHTNTAHELYGPDDLSADDAAAVRADVEAFVLDNLSDFRASLETRNYDPREGTAADYFGHDFLLTRSGHGAGFWDRGLDDLGDRLTEAAKPYGEAHVMVSESGISLM